jgi:SAM-dependent methyltransferase
MNNQSNTVLHVGEHDDPSTTGYSLTLSEEELERYRAMAAMAADSESEQWRDAGIVEGARVADVGCGPGATLRVLAERVGREGRVIGVDADPGAISHALEEVAALPQATAQVGTATESGLEPGRFEVVMCRHVLAHNGGREGAIVRHLASLASPGGCVYLVDFDLTLLHIPGEDPDLQDLRSRYVAFQQARGNDLSIGLRLGDLLTEAGLAVEWYGVANPSLVRWMPVHRGAAWAARGDMIAKGVATEADVARWEAALTRSNASERRPWVFVPVFVASGRRE